MMQPKIALGDTFLEAFAAIPRGKQKKLMEFVSKFRRNPEATGINYEKINDASDPAFRSVRIDQEYRGIVLKPDVGNVYILLWVDKHDDAYIWARRNRCRVNPTTGVLQLFEVDEPQVVQQKTVDTAPSAKPQLSITAPSSKSKGPLFSLDDDTLLRLGVPEPLLAVIKSLSSEIELETMEKQLPVEAFEALYLLAAQTPLDQVLEEYAAPKNIAIDTTDLAKALAHPGSQRRFHVVDDEMELIQMLEAPLERWRVFLHPSQRQLVERHWNGPVRVLGGAGTGKTVVAMHRARWLVSNVLKGNEKLLFTTFTYNLATDISNSLKKICTPEQFSKIEVKPINEWVSHFVRRQKYPSKIVFPQGLDGLYEGCWNAAKQLIPAELELPESFYREEWERVILAQQIADRMAYLKASRNGRGVALNRKQRSDIWPVFEEMRLQLSAKGLVTAEDAMHYAIHILSTGEDSRQYRAVVVDEGQDLGPEAMSLIRRLAGEQSDDLFIVGDGHQRIYQRKTSLSHCGINIRGRGKKLKINYRTTEQIRRFATALLEGISVDDLDDGNDSVTDYRSLVQGEQPQLYLANNLASESLWIIDQIKKLIEEGVEQADMCIVARSQHLIDDYEQALKKAGFSICRLSRDQADDRSKPGIRLATMHRVKGLEFKAVFMAAINQGVVPLQRSIDATDDPVERRLRDLNERALFHVAATRAIRWLFISSYGAKSPYLLKG